MDLQLNGKRALVTGSTAGIGLATATMLLREGATVVVNGRTQARVDAALAHLAREAPGAAARAHGLAADLTTEGGAGLALAAFPEIDVLVNNLGAYEAKEVQALTAEDFARMFDVNVVSGARLALAYLPGMRTRNQGRIVFVASETGVNVPPDMIPYGVSKAAQIALARGLAETTAGTAITINSVIPGPTLSEGIGTFLASLPVTDGGDVEAGRSAFLRQLRPTSLLRRFATADEVASLIVYLASERAAATNGAALRVEGGLLRSVL